MEPERSRSAKHNRQRQKGSIRALSSPLRKPPHSAVTSRIRTTWQSTGRRSLGASPCLLSCERAWWPCVKGAAGWRSLLFWADEYKSRGQRMARTKVYTLMGRRIAELVTNQKELAQVLGLTQQSVSGKLRGRIAISLAELRMLSDHFDVPIFYFLERNALTPELARAWEKVVKGSPELHRIVEIAASFPRPFALQLLRIVESLECTVAHYNTVDG